jgi:hypothetical protein
MLCRAMNRRREPAPADPGEITLDEIKRDGRNQPLYAMAPPNPRSRRKGPIRIESAALCKPLRYENARRNGAFLVR